MKIVGILYFFATLLLVNASSKSIKNVEKSIYQFLYERMHGDVDDNENILTRAEAASVETKWIEQKLDNFDENNSQTWQRRYMINSQYYQPGGPLFIYVGGEAAIRATSISGLRHIVNLARDHNGYILHPEHRYYGQSKPTPDLSTDNLKYLDVRQALADLAYFINSMKKTIPGAQNSKVILVGGSYPASMATWFKIMYPDMIVGSWASSGPLFAKTDFYEYKEVVGQSIKDVGGEECYKRINNSFSQLQKMFAEKRLAEVKALFKVCDDFNENSQLDVWNFFSVISEMFSGLVQYAVPGDIEKVCKSFNDQKDDYISLATYILGELEKTTCNNMTYKSMIASMEYTNYEGGNMRQWTYQTCNEFGWFQTSTSTSQPFGSWFPLDYSLQICKDLFGEKFTPEFINQQVASTNSFFKGYTPGVENVYFTQGALDPWNAMGIKSNVIPLASHCADLRSPTPNDSQLLLTTRVRASQLVKEWLENA